MPESSTCICPFTSCLIPVGDESQMATLRFGFLLANRAGVSMRRMSRAFFTGVPFVSLTLPFVPYRFKSLAILKEEQLFWRRWLLANNYTKRRLPSSVALTTFRTNLAPNILKNICFCNLIATTRLHLKTRRKIWHVSRSPSFCCC